MSRIVTKERKTKETDIKLTLNLDGSGVSKIDTGIGFFDHMLDGFTRHGLFDLELTCKGDLNVDCHHTIEDVGIVLGTAIKDAIGEISAENIEDVAELVSSKIIDGKEINTYLQQFEGYEVYYKDVLNDALDEVEDFVVSQVIVTGGDYTTDEGISVGDSKKDVISAYGKGHEVRLTGGKRLIDYELGDKTIEFTINRDGDVEEICIYLSQR